MKKQNGISLVALVITIIVMVILAGIIITSAVGDNGIIDRAQKANMENERALAEDLVIGSYVFENLASDKIYGTLNLEKTAIAICQNLNNNGFTVNNTQKITDDNGEEVETLKVSGGIISIDIKGKYGEYTGEVNKTGLVEKIKIKGDKTDLDILREKLVGEVLSMESLGQDITVKAIQVKIGNEIYMNDQTGQEILNEITYKGNNYTLYLTALSEITSEVTWVDNKIENQIYYNEQYTSTDPSFEGRIIVSEENIATFNMGGDSGQAPIKLYDNNVYSPIEGMENTYIRMGRMIYGGRVFFYQDMLTLAIAETSVLEYDYLNYKIDTGKFIGSTPDSEIAGILPMTNPKLGLFFGENQRNGCIAVVSDEGIVYPFVDGIVINDYGVIQQIEKENSSEEITLLGIVDPITHELKATNNKLLDIENQGIILQNSILKYDKKYGLKIYDSNEYVNITVNPENVWGTTDGYEPSFSGTVSYWFAEDVCYMVLKNKEMYIVVESFEKNEYTLEEEKNKFVIKEMDYTTMEKKENNIEYTINGTDIEKVN